MSMAVYQPLSGTFEGLWNGTKGADIASATSIDLGAATGNFVDVTGTTTITALGTATAGITRLVRFTGALQLTYHATSLKLPGAANITTVAGDSAVFVSLGSGNWICVAYFRASGLGIIGLASGNKVIASPANGSSGEYTGRALVAADLPIRWLIKTTTYTAVAFDKIQADTSGGAWTLTLPASAAVGDEILVEDAALTWASNNLTINRNGLKINGGTTNYTANVDGGKLSIVYISVGQGWSIK